MPRPLSLRALFVGLLLIGAGPAAAEETYVRWESGRSPDQGALRTAVATYQHPDEDIRVALYGVVHIADMSYYREVQKDLDGYDVVLYEGVGSPEERAQGEGSDLGEIQGLMGEMLGLSFQKDGIDYTRKNLVHADMTMAELKKALGGASISPLGGAMDEEQAGAFVPMLKMLGQLGAMFLKSNPEMQNRVKLMMGQSLANADLTQHMGKQIVQAILLDRNAVVMKVLAREVEKMEKGSIAIFYGAAHHPDLAKRLEGLGYTRTDKRWMSAWKVGGTSRAAARRQPSRPGNVERPRRAGASRRRATPAGKRWH